MKTLILATMISLAGLSPLCAATSIERVFEAEEFSGANELRGPALQICDKL